MKTYKIATHNRTTEVILEIHENELTKDHKDFFLGNLLHAFNESPPEIQNIFLKGLKIALENKSLK